MLTEEKKKVVEYYNEGLDAYKARDWDRAIEAFKKALEVDPKDGPSRLYLERCEVYKETPPPDDWDGVFTMTTK